MSTSENNLFTTPLENEASKETENKIDESPLVDVAVGVGGIIAEISKLAEI